MIKGVISLGLMGCFALSMPSLAAEVEATCALSAATVYSNRAMLSCEAQTTLAAGEHKIIFKDMPITIDPNSLRIKGVSVADMELGALSHKRVNEAALVNEREKELQSEIEKFDDQLAELRARLNTLNLEKEFYESLKAQSARSAQEEISVYEFNTEKWIAAGKTIFEAIAALESERLSINKQITQITEQKAKLQNDMAQVRTGATSTLEVSVPVEAKAGGKLSLELDYQVPNARWYPVYDARLDTTSGKLELIQYGAVSQNTGEDWSDIQLTLSTAQPQRGASVPNLNSMWVNLFDPNRRKNFSSISSNIAGGALARKVAASQEEMADVSAMPVSIEPPRAVGKEIRQRASIINTGGFTAEYEIAGPASVLSDGSAAKLLIGSFDNETTLKVHVKPQLSDKAYLVAHGELAGDVTMLPGKVNLFRDNAFIGQTRINLLKGGAELELSFGIDDRITVIRKTVKDESSEKGMFVGSNVKERVYSTEVKNLRDKAVSLVVDETIPAPKDKKIEVSVLTDQTTAGYKKDADKITGLLRWEFALESKGEKDVTLGWQIKWPDNQNLGGLR
ncbi:MAG: mucoidy inhibitor MuiA family protein [Micavibrio sp.]|nr:mucoidy inhibitor MuiA family protein [Micavibrio sp.]